VIAVVIFHFSATSVPGGFAGVDIFFVISGFLMTSIILRGLETPPFSLFKFYVARANRIIPSLAVVCLVLLVLGWFYLAPMDYRMLGKHVSGSLSFLSNVIYWREAGYFDAASKEKWLLHTWSLSVEWQFYIIYPIILMALNTLFSLAAIKRLLVVGTCLGFATCIFVTLKWPTPAYYLFPTRAWEMMFGGLAYIYPIALKEVSKKGVELSGLTLICLSYFLMNSSMPWPGYYALVPVVGSYLIIIANRQRSVLTDNVIFRYLGKWSYSIYLWHWPVVVVGYYFNISHWLYVGLPLSIMLGFVNYQLVESVRFTPFDRWTAILQVKPLHYVAIVGLAGSIVFAFKGQNELTVFMTPEQHQALNSLQTRIVMPYRGNGYCFYDFNSDKTLKPNNKQATECILGDKSKAPDTLLFGSSFAGMYDPLLDEVFDENGKSLNSVSTNWCSPILEDNFVGPKTDISYTQCLSNRHYLHNVIKQKLYKTIILADEWDVVENKGLLGSVENLVKQASEKGINVVILPIPKQYTQDPLQLYYREYLRNEKIDLSQDNIPGESDDLINQKLQTMAQKYSNVHFIPRDSLFLKSGLFYSKEQNIMVPYTLDGEHISMLGSQSAAEHFLQSEDYKKIFKPIIN